ncbi:hypothetical protein QEH59_17380 [Coraliomargarita sp. SDUM461004]|uniref:Uncharacterized protein n=1 Tax=Thalassobacterium sedimentorum TaxID=3041258 RepID=A0ABU1AQQ3_9BACT|nr:hypothetical protein [Coraliomargarita sp. SDUM461004]MDQ8196210.1 hypothetical protein [Coraliomargarita sp. SDUM461004]
MNFIVKKLMLVGIFFVATAYSETTEDILADYINRYSLSIEFEGLAEEAKSGCPSLVITSTDSSQLTWRVESLWRDVSIRFKIRYLNDEGKRDRARWFSTTTFLPTGASVDENGIVDTFDQSAFGVSLVDTAKDRIFLCPHLEWFKQSLVGFIHDSPKLKLETIQSIELQFGFKDLLVISNVSEDAGIYFYTKEFILDGEALDKFILLLAEYYLDG